MWPIKKKQKNQIKPLFIGWINPVLLKNDHTCSINLWSVSCSKGLNIRRSSWWQRGGSKNEDAATCTSGTVRSAASSLRIALRFPVESQKRAISNLAMTVSQVWEQGFKEPRVNVNLHYQLALIYHSLFNLFSSLRNALPIEKLNYVLLTTG